VALVLFPKQNRRSKGKRKGKMKEILKLKEERIVSRDKSKGR
jgi:hypothetical protein